jgi:hypothetical protein
MLNTLEVSHTTMLPFLFIRQPQNLSASILKSILALFKTCGNRFFQILKVLNKEDDMNWYRAELDGQEGQSLNACLQEK